MPTWADETEFTQFLWAAGLISQPQTTVQQLLDLPGALSDATEQWQNLTYFWPYLSTGNVNETRDFYPSGGMLLDLNSGLLTITSLTTDETYQSNGSLGGGTTRLNIRDFRMMPADAPPQKMPWTYILTSWVNTGVVRVTGEWGFTTQANLTSTARRAHMALAALSLMPQISYQLTRGGLKMLQQGDSEKQWGKIEEMGKAWQSMVDAALKQYKRPRISS